MRNWKRDLVEFGADNIDITHDMTHRYFRAFNQRSWIVKECQILGWKVSEKSSCFEIAVWMPHPQGLGKCGYYSTLRLFYNRDRLSSVEIYSFYDGKDKSICIKSIHNAKIYSKKWGFHD